MADEKKNAVNNADTSETAKSEKKDKIAKKDKKPSRFSPKNIFKAIGRFFKDLRGETKKIVWPGRKMVIKSTGVVLAVILVVGAGIWVLDFALSEGVSGLVEISEKIENEEEEADTDTDTTEATTTEA